MKQKTVNAFKISVISALVAIILVFATLSVCAYFSTRVYVYTENGQEVAQVGMNLRLLFGELDSSKVAEGADLKIPRYEVENNYVVYYDGVDHTAETNGTDQRTKYDPDAPWGSAQNPYIISETRHLQNLSALQNVGYFDLLYIASNFENGEYQEGSASIPYFLICDTDGTPITIDGSELDSAIKPIGNAEHPFIGVIGGAFIEGETQVKEYDAQMAVKNTRTSSVSAIHGFKIKTNTNQTDVGLFGYVGFMGDEPTVAELKELMKNETYVPGFEGVFSSIKNVLLSDVQVTVNNPTVVETLSELFEPFWKEFFGESNVLHRFTYSDKTAAEAQVVFHETHHIGIFAGHVSYAMIDNISVYYSNDDAWAIDLTHVLDKDGNTLTGDSRNNYYSASGILGMIYNMNCSVENQTNDNCRVLLGTGTTGDDVTDGSGTGTGGGALSGNGRGYVTAAEIFSEFNNVAVKEDANNELLWRYRITNDGAWTNGILVFEKTRVEGETTVTYYTLADGKTEVELSQDKKSVKDTVNNKTWTEFFVLRAFLNGDGEQEFEYFAFTASGTETLVYDCELLGNKDNGQTIWRYIAGSDGIWHYGIRVYKNGDVYKLEDNTVVYLEDGYIVKKKTENDTTTVVAKWANYFITETTTVTTGTTPVTTTSHYMYDRLTEETKSVTLFEHKPMTLIEAYRTVTTNGTSTNYLLCEQWMAPTALGDMPSGSYYFYDGVFTFGLSSKNDTVLDTWRSEEIPTLNLGARDPDAWGVDTDRGNRTLVALLTPVTSNKQLDLAISQGKQFYISAQPPTSSDAYLMSLITENKKDDQTYTKQKPGTQGDKKEDFEQIPIKVDTPGKIMDQRVSLENNLRDQLYSYYFSGVYSQLPMSPIVGQKDQVMTKEVYVDGELTRQNVTLGDLQDPNFWQKYTVLNVGRTSSSLSLAELKKQYNIVATNVGNTDSEGNIDKKYYYYLDGSDIYVGSAIGDTTQLSNDGKIPVYQVYNEFIYYTVSYEVKRETEGTYSGTKYERERLYTFTFYYQPAPVNGVVQDPVYLGYTTAYIYGIDSGGNTSRMPDFDYGMVYLGQGTQQQSTTVLQTLDDDEVRIDRYYRRRRVTYVSNGREQTRDNTSATVNKYFINNNVSITAKSAGNNYTQATTTSGELLFTLQYNGRTIDLPMVNMTANRFHGTQKQTETEAVAAILSEGYAAKEVTGANADEVNYYYYDVATELFYLPGRSDPVAKGDMTDAQYASYMSTQYSGYTRLNRYPAYEFSDNSDATIRSYLQFLHLYDVKNYWYGKNGDKYSLWAGRADQYASLDMKKGYTTMTNGNVSDPVYDSYSTEGVLIFENGTCYIQYTYSNTTDDWERNIDQGYGAGYNDNTARPKTDHLLTRYVGYTYDSESKELEYTFTTTKTKLYVYIIEGVIDTSYGVNTFVPDEDATDDQGNSYNPPVYFNATDVVLWPQTTLKPNGVYTNNGNTAYDTSDTAENATMTATTDPVYKVIPLTGENGIGLNWGTSTGYILGANGSFGLDKKFHMADQSSFGKLNISGGNVSWVSNPNLMFAPVGSNGVETIIPKGCVAFKVESGGTQTVRIIVSVPVTESYRGEGTFDLDMLNDYYVALWQMPDIDKDANGDQYITFEKSSALEKFELPRSYSFSFDDSPVTVESMGKHYVDLVYDLNGNGTIDVWDGTEDFNEDGVINENDTINETYRTYLNGDTFLVAYEFTVQGNGVYVIGSVHGADDKPIETDVPMEIVHFSVSGSASAGRDGVSGNQLGSIDFVYDDTANTIVTIDRQGATTGIGNGGTEFYSNYYASQSLLYSDNEAKVESNFIRLDNAKLYIRRKLVGTTTGDQTTYRTTLSYKVVSTITDAFRIRSYAINSDAVDKRTN